MVRCRRSGAGQARSQGSTKSVPESDCIRGRDGRVDRLLRQAIHLVDAGLSRGCHQANVCQLLAQAGGNRALLVERRERDCHRLERRLGDVLHRRAMHLAANGGHGVAQGVEEVGPVQQPRVFCDLEDVLVEYAYAPVPDECVERR